MELDHLQAAPAGGSGARTSFRLDDGAFAYLEDARIRSRITHGRSTDRGKLVCSVLHGLAIAGFDLSEPEPERIAFAVAERLSGKAGEP